MNLINVLVFPCGSEIGLEIHRSLKDIRIVKLFGGSSVDDHGRFVYKNYIGDIPYVTDKGFIQRIKQVCEENDIDYIFPAMDNVILELSKHRDEINATLLTSAKETVDICRSKSKTYKALYGCDFLPNVYETALDVKEYPVLLKPSVGQGSQGVKVIKTKKELVYELEIRADDQVICEYLPGEEYTIDCFTDRFGKLRYASCRNRHRIKNGISVNSSLMEPDDRVRYIAEQINSKLSFHGVWFFQLKRNKYGDYRLLECATRVAGTMCVERVAGVNLPLLTIFDAMGCDIDLNPQVQHVMVDRALHSVYKISLVYDEAYIDFDDTIIVHDRVNTTALAFCYQCVQENKRLILITRHETDVVKDLLKYRIYPGLFDQIICIPRSERKIDHIFPGRNALFIDDSFAERKLVHEAFGIPALGVDAIEALLDYRQ